MAKNLTKKQEAFLAAYIETGNATEAYRRGYDCSRMKEATINRKALEVLNNGTVAARLKELRAAASASVTMTAIDVLKRWVDIATANPNDLVQHRRVNCRHCHGVAYKFQWRDQDEYALACAQVLKKNSMLKLKAQHDPMPEDAGGYGFNFKAAPNRDCPHCSGEGQGEDFIADTVTAKSPLYAGLKRTRDGIEIKMRDQDAALLNIAKFLGMMKDGAVTIINTGPTVNAAQVVPTDPMEAARFYKEFMSKS